MRTSTYREIPYNFTSADDRLIIRQLFGESVWDDVEELRSLVGFRDELALCLK